MSNLISDADPSSLSYELVSLLEVVFRVLNSSSDSLHERDTRINLVADKNTKICSL